MDLLPIHKAKAKAKATSSCSTRIITNNSKEKFPTKKRPIYRSQSGSRNQDLYKPMPMEEMMMVMMKIRSRDIAATHHHHHSSNNNITTTSPCPSWKLYENPFYNSHTNNSNHNHTNHLKQDPSSDQNPKQIHRLHLPISARKIAASFWDLTFVKPLMESDLESARSQIEQLKAELESERKARKKLESQNKKLANQLSEERKAREALELVCQELSKQSSSDKAEIDMMKREMAEERKMLRVAEVIREERVQMKLAEAKILMEEKLSQYEIVRKTHDELTSSSSSSYAIANKREGIQEAVIVNANNSNNNKRTYSFGERIRFVLGEKMPSATTNINVGIQAMAVMQRKAVSPEAENPHIKRGIKGFVEFPKVARAIGCKSKKHLGSKLECQTAQLKILLKQKGDVRLNGLITT